MHPIVLRDGRAGVYLYLAQWLLIGSLLAAILAAQPAVTLGQSLLVSIPLATVYAFVCGSAWYVSRTLPLRGTRAARIAATAMAASLISSAAWLVLAEAWVLTVARWLEAPALSPAFAGLRTLFLAFGLLLYLLSLAVSYLLATMELSQAAERRGLEVQVLAREAELRSLRAQIDPHFLFNSLHSISALTSVDPAAARRMCVLLADFLRESLALGGEERIPLGRELTLARRYLEVEQVRFGERLRVEIESAEADGCPVAPLLLQPLVENAVTHGIAHLLDGGTIRVRAVRTAAALVVTIENPCAADRPRRTGAGVGLANVRSRLRAMHGEEARLDASEQAGVWQVTIRVPAEDGAS